MKKFLIGIIAVISILIMSFALTACANASDSTYKFSDVKVAFGRNVSESDKAIGQFKYDAMKNKLEGYEYVFEETGHTYKDKDENGEEIEVTIDRCGKYTYGKKDEDGEYLPEGKKTGFYKQVGSTLYLLSSESNIEKEGEELEEIATSVFEVANGKIVLEERDEETGTVVKTIYKK